jgi:hypothetical protein
MADRDDLEFTYSLIDRIFRLSLGELAVVPSLGPGQIVTCASERFRLLASSSGRLDHIQTIAEWRRRFAEPSLRKTLLKLRLVPHWLTSADFRLGSPQA